MSTPRNIRRVVTGHDAAGKSVHVVDDHVDLKPMPSGVVLQPMHEADHLADNSSTFVDRLDSISKHLVNPGGTKLFITESPPTPPGAPLMWHRTDSCVSRHSGS